MTLAEKQSRHQRQEAIKIMRAVNQTFLLPNPTPWRKVVLDGLKRTVKRLMEALKLHKSGIVRVSLYQADENLVCNWTEIELATHSRSPSRFPDRGSSSVDYDARLLRPDGWFCHLYSPRSP